MNHLELFDGAGGLALGFQKDGLIAVGYIENNKYATKTSRKMLIAKKFLKKILLKLNHLKNY